LILIGIGVIIGVMICRKRSNTPVIEGPDDFTTPTYVPAQRIEPRIRYSNENRRSQRASLYVEENRKGNYHNRKQQSTCCSSSIISQLFNPLSEPDLLHRVELDLQE